MKPPALPGALRKRASTVQSLPEAKRTPALAKGRSVIRNAASEPHVQDLCNFLVLLGAHIEGIGILRMTHRADTDNAKAWWHQINEESRAAIFFYRGVADALGIQLPDLTRVSPLNAAAA